MFLPLVHLLYVNTGRLGPWSRSFEVVSLIKELIKERLHASKQITETRRGAGADTEGISELIGFFVVFFLK